MGGKSRYFEKDEIIDIEKCPKYHFAPLKEAPIDFGTATEEMMIRSSNWKIADALAYLKDKFKYTASGPPMTKKDVAKLIVDMRFRKVKIPKE